MIIAVVLIILVVVVLKYLDNGKYRDLGKIPGPPTIPLFGNSLSFGTNSATAFKYQLQVIKEYGKFVRIWIGSKPTLIICEPSKIEYILSSNEHINKGSSYDYFKPFLGNGLVTSKGSYWKKHRKLITPTFHFKILEQFVPCTNKNSKILISHMKKHIGEKSTDIHDNISRYNLDVISEAAMSTKIDAQNQIQSSYLEAARGFVKITIIRCFSLFKQQPLLFMMSKDYWRQKGYVKTLHAFVDDVIKSRKEERKTLKTEKQTVDDTGIKKRTAFLDLLLDMQENDGSLSDKEIREEVDTFMFAGHDTITSSVDFGIYELSKHPLIQERLVVEYISIVGNDPNADLNYQQLNEMKYLEIVIKELMRLHAPVPFFARELESDIKLDGLLIPKGTDIQIMPYAMHRMEEFFPDPMKFDPERFRLENSSKRHPFCYIPFSAGPRNCIGQRYAMLAVKAVVIKMLVNFEILPAEPHFEPLLTNFGILKSQNGIHVQLKERVI